ncbi:hypothetical protein BH09MYX1_BH09MYX1_34070 [soil metagenome]
MEGPAVLTIEAVNALVPELNALVQLQIDRREAIELALTELAQSTGQPRGDLTARPDDSAIAREKKRDILVRIDAYQRAWRRLDEMGGVLKDPARGLVDFYGRIDTKLVWLCWCYGEREVTHYHQLDEGFTSRKPIDARARKNALN